MPKGTIVNVSSQAEAVTFSQIGMIVAFYGLVAAIVFTILGIEKMCGKQRRDVFITED